VAACVSQRGPKPLGGLTGLLRGKGCSSVLDLLGLAHMSIARYSCGVSCQVVLLEGACMVVGEGLVELPARLTCVATPPASRAAAPPRGAEHVFMRANPRVTHIRVRFHTVLANPNLYLYPSIPLAKYTGCYPYPCHSLGPYHLSCIITAVYGVYSFVQYIAVSVC
jgi:hypothetical protein